MPHPTDAHLAAYAAGTISDGLGLLVASHLTFCPRCRDRVARLETIGGAFLGEGPPDGIAPPDLDGILARLGEGDAPAPRVEDDPVLPRPLREVVGRPSAAIRWRPLLPGLADCPLSGSAGEDVRLVRARPGARILAHSHEGCEATLVLAGSLRDGGLSFGRGDVSICGPEDDHHPEAVGPETCICLVVIEGRLRFTGPVARVLNLFAR